MSTSEPPDNENSEPTQDGASQSTRGAPGDAVELGEDVMGSNAAERDARRDALKSMLEASEARVKRARRSVKPVLAIGHQVQIRSGASAGLSGTVLDADFINSRVLVETESGQPAAWLSFDHVEVVTDDP